MAGKTMDPGAGSTGRGTRRRRSTQTVRAANIMLIQALPERWQAAAARALAALHEQATPVALGEPLGEPLVGYTADDDERTDDVLDLLVPRRPTSDDEAA